MRWRGVRTSSSRCVVCGIRALLDVPDECLLLVEAEEAEELSAEEEAAAGREAAERAAFEARHASAGGWVAGEEPRRVPAEFDQITFSCGASLADSELTYLEEGVESGPGGAW